MAKSGTEKPELGWKEKLDKSIHEKNCFTEVLEKAEELTGVKRLYIVIGEIKRVLQRIYPRTIPDQCNLQGEGKYDGFEPG